MIEEYLAMVACDAMFDRRCQIDVVASEALIRHSTCDFAHEKVSIMTVKQPLAANCHLFDRFVTSQVVPYNPAADEGPELHHKAGKDAGARRDRSGVTARQCRCEDADWAT